MNYIKCGDYYIPDLKLDEETRSIGHWGRLHREYLREHCPIQLEYLVLSGKLWTYLADLNDQATERMEIIVGQLQKSEGVTEDMKSNDFMAWVGSMSSIQARAEEIILQELIYC